jgi:hypothetical protein
MKTSTSRLFTSQSPVQYILGSAKAKNVKSDAENANQQKAKNIQSDMQQDIKPH